MSQVLKQVKMPERLYGTTEEAYQELKNSFLSDLAEVRRQEETGIVARIDVVNLILSGWALRRQWRVRQESELFKQVQECRQIARKYGLTKIWDASWHDTLLKRMEEKFSGDYSDLAKTQCCGRCGRAIWNPLSVKRGVGPICYHKPS